MKLQSLFEFSKKKPVSAGLVLAAGITFAGGGAITPHAVAADLVFNAASPLEITVTNDQAEVTNNAGGIIFTDYVFGETGTGLTITGSGGLLIQTEGPGNNLTFNQGVNLDTSAFNNEVTFESINGEVVSNGAFTFVSNGGSLFVSAGADITFNDSFTATQTGDGHILINAYYGSITHGGAFTYNGASGSLYETAANLIYNGAVTIGDNSNSSSVTLSGNQGILFGGTLNITQTGNESIEITSYNGSITHEGAFTYNGTNGILYEYASNNLIYNDTVTIGDNSNFSGGVSLVSDKSVLFGSTLSITQTGEGATVITSDGSITHEGAFTYNGAAGNLTEQAWGDYLTYNGAVNIGGNSNFSGSVWISGDQNILFGDTLDITKTGNGTTYIHAYEGSITHTGAFTYNGETGYFGESAGTDLIYNDTVTIGDSSNFSGSVSLQGYNNILFNDIVDITQTGNNYNSNIITQNGSITHTGDFTYKGGASAFSESAGTDLIYKGLVTMDTAGSINLYGNSGILFGDDANDTVSITQTGEGSTTIISNGDITHAGDFVYQGAEGGLTEWAQETNLSYNGSVTMSNESVISIKAYQDITFGDVVNITQTGIEGTGIITVYGSITHMGDFTYNGEMGALMEQTTWAGDLLYNGAVTIGNNSSFSGDVTLLSYENIQFGDTVNITQTGEGSTQIGTYYGSITHAGDFTHNGENGGMVEAAWNGDLTHNGAVTVGNDNYTGYVVFASDRDIVFNGDVDITQTGDNETRIYATGIVNGGIVNSSITFNANFNYSGEDGSLSMEAYNNGNITLTGDDSITFTGNGEASLMGNTVTLGNMTQTGGTLNLLGKSNMANSITLNSATLNTDWLQAFNLTINDTAAANIGTLDLGKTTNTQPLMLALNNADAGLVNIDLLRFYNGNAMTTSALDIAAGTAVNIQHLYVSGINNTVTDNGNALNFSGKTLTFDLPANITNNNTMLNFGSGNPVNISGATVTLIAHNQLAALNTWDTIRLINGDTQTSGAIANAGEHMVLYGATEYLFDVYQDTSLFAQLLGKGPNPDFAKAYLEGMVASLQVLNMGQETLLSRGLPQILTFAKDRTGFIPFATVNGGTYRIKSGSHVDVNGYNLLGGLAFGFDTERGRTIIGAFIEGGGGNSSTYNNFSRLRVHGDTDTSYFGGGVLARHNFTESANGNFYADASLRGGRVKSDFKTHDMGEDATYDSRANYFGAHIGVGYGFKVYAEGTLETYGQLLWTHQGGDSVTTDASERLNIHASDSLRSRLGARLNHAVSENFCLFGGMGWEYEFDGEVSGKLNGIRINSPEMKGSSGFIELGFNLNLTENISIQAAGQGYVGQREGVSGSLGLVVGF